MKAAKVWVLISIDDKNDPVVEEFELFSALKVRMRGILANDPQYKLLENGRPVSWDWGEPELHIGESSAPAKKPRAKRSDAGTKRVVVGRTRGFAGPNGEPGEVGDVVAEVKA
jgi:hypothetical protein